MPRILPYLGALVAATLAIACGGDDAIDSDEEARRAYLGLHESIEKSLNLGFDGYNAASSANIDPQAGVGDETGDLTITGQVAQGNSDNHEMRLYVGMVDYSDGVFVVVINEGTDDEEEVEVELEYDTAEAQLEQPYLHLSLRNVPDGTFDGDLTGTYFLAGDIEGDVEVNLLMSGELEAGANDTVVRTVGATTITGTATSGDGVFDVNLSL